MTELARKSLREGMDILGGAAIMRGPRNFLAHGYFAMPINITVEGANILTRTLMIFGQGAIRCHPYAFKEIEALMNADVKQFDEVFWKHLGHVVRNLFRSVLLSVTRGYLAKSPVSGPTAKYYRRLSWASASFALLADIALARYGGNLKRMEKLTGRFADIFSWLYLGTAALRRFEAEGRLKEDLPFIHWTMQLTLAEIQNAFDGIYQNMGAVFRPAAFWSRLNTLGNMPSDKTGSQVAQALQIPGAQRDRITAGIYISKDAKEAVGRLENALKLLHESEPVSKKINAALRDNQLKKDSPLRMIESAVKIGIITKEEADLFARAEAAREDAIQVDTFTPEEYMNIPDAPGSARKKRGEALLVS
jgi:acyl-CoA dehydrogenase